MSTRLIVHLASAAPIKLAALFTALREEDNIVASTVALPTPTPQPVSLAEALECVAARLAGIRAGAVAAEAQQAAKEQPCDRSDICLMAIENFVYCAPGIINNQRDAWFDAALVVIEDASGLRRCTRISNLHAPVDKKFWPVLAGYRDAPTDRATRITYGALLHAEDSTVDAQNWMGRVSSIDVTSPAAGSQRPLFVDRAGQLRGALSTALRDWQGTLAGPLTVVRNFPKAGVDFLDVFAYMSTYPGMMHLVAVLRQQVQGWMPYVYASWAGDNDGDNLRRAQRIAVAGLESRGLVLGALMAADLGTAFLPIRKPGKLPGTVLRQDFEKEYGSDAFELAATAPVLCDNAGEITDVIVCDDVLATGGSTEAACLLLERAGFRVRLIVCLTDVLPLRSKWQERLAGRWPVALCRLRD